MFWFISVILGLFPAAALIGIVVCQRWYRRPWERMDVAIGFLEKPNVFDLYRERFAPQAKAANEIVGRIYRESYRPPLYIFSLSLVFVPALVGGVIVAQRVGLAFPLPQEADDLINEIPRLALVGLVGAYFWSLSDLIRRFRNSDIPPGALLYVFFRLASGPIIVQFAFGWLEQLPTELADLLALILGAFPVGTVLELAGWSLLRRSQRPEQGLRKIPGINDVARERLSEEGIGSLQMLAGTDPIRLYIKTGMEMMLITELIEQAHLLTIFAEDYNQVAQLREMGVIGSVRMREKADEILPQPDYSPFEPEKDFDGVLKEMAQRLRVEEAAILSVLRAVKNEPQIQLLQAIRAP